MEEINKAVENIKGKAIRTPLLRLNAKDQKLHGPEIYLKLENLQPIGRPKIFSSQ